MVSAICALYEWYLYERDECGISANVVQYDRNMSALHSHERDMSATFKNERNMSAFCVHFALILHSSHPYRAHSAI